MGKPSQKRLIRKIDLEKFLNGIKAHPSPKASFEQYTTSASAAAALLYLAAYTRGDILGKKIIDLGCGTGRLALGAAFLGAKCVVGVDVDKTAINVAFENSIRYGFKDIVEWVVADVKAIEGKFDTVLQNPPFGVQKHAADRKFLEKALDLGCSIYSLHNHPTKDKKLKSMLKSGGGQPVRIEASPFIQKFVEERGARVEVVYSLLLLIPKMFDFHTKERFEIIVDLYVIRNES